MFDIIIESGICQKRSGKVWNGYVGELQKNYPRFVEYNHLIWYITCAYIMPCAPAANPDAQFINQTNENLKLTLSEK